MGTQCEVSGLRVSQLAEGQANKKTWCSQDQGRQRCCIASGYACLATEGYLLAGRAQGSENWYGSHGQVSVPLVLGIDGN